MILFHLLEIIFPLIFLLVLGMFIFMFARGIHTWHNNNHSPRLTVPAKIVSKRQSTMHHSHPNSGDISGAHGITVHQVPPILSRFRLKVVTEWNYQCLERSMACLQRVMRAD